MAPQGLRRWVTKHATGMCGVGKFLHIWGQEKGNHCPLCGEAEDSRHVNRCTDPRAVAHWLHQLDRFGEWLESRSTDPAITEALLQLLHCYHGNLEWIGPHGEVGRAAARQWKGGPANLAEGLLVTDWAPLQQQHYRRIKSRRSGCIRWSGWAMQSAFSAGVRRVRLGPRFSGASAWPWDCRSWRGAPAGWCAFRGWVRCWASGC